MMRQLGDLGSQKSIAEAQLNMPRALTLREQLEQQKTQAEAQVARATELLQLLEENPGINRALELLRAPY